MSPATAHPPLRLAESIEGDRRSAAVGLHRQIAHHVGKLGALGFEVTLCRIPQPGQDDSAAAPAG